MKMFEQTAAFTSAELCMRIRNTRTGKDERMQKERKQNVRKGGREREREKKGNATTTAKSHKDKWL